MKRIPSLLLPLLLFLVLPATAQEAEPEWYTVYAEHVPISNRSAFEEGLADLISIFEDANISDASWVTIQGNEIGFSYVFAGTGPGDLDELNETWGGVMAKLGDRGAKAMAKSDALVDSREMYFLMLRPDLSYRPDDVGISADKPFRHYTQLYVHPAKTTEFEASIPAWIAAYADAGVESGWRTYQYMTGSDLPAYLIVGSAKSEADYYARTAETESKLGDKIGELRAKTGPTLRRAEDTSGMVRGDLSYPQFGGGN